MRLSEALWEVTCLQDDVSAGGIMGKVGGKGKLMTFAKRMVLNCIDRVLGKRSSDTGNCKEVLALK